MPAPSEPSTAPLSRDELQRALALPVLDAAGTSAPLASHLAAGTPTLLVLVRHHHCGMCIEYCRTLWEQLAPATHDAQRPKLLVVGHGEARGIASYKERSGWLGEMVVDPTRKVFGALGCVSGLLNAPEKQVRGMGPCRGSADRGTAGVSREAQHRQPRAALRGPDAALRAARHLARRRHHAARRRVPR
jgi:hypothetical protein